MSIGFQMRAIINFMIRKSNEVYSELIRAPYDTIVERCTCFFLEDNEYFRRVSIFIP